LHSQAYLLCQLQIQENNLFSGDTLFLEGVGRSDLPGGNAETLKKSIKTKLYTLDDGLTAYPGHMDKTSIGHEKKNNFFVNLNS